MRVDELRPIALFDGLSDEQLLELAEAGEEVTFGVGDDLFHEGAPADAWWVLLDGRIDLVRRAGREDNVLGSLDAPGRWAGGFRAWDEHGVYLATGRGSVPGRAFHVDSDELRRLCGAWFPFGVHLITGLFQSARRIEQSARQREALVALGTLAAGLAHEINNPASAATRAVETLESASGDVLESLRRLSGCAISAEQFTALDGLRRQLEPSSAPRSALALADLEEELADWMGEREVERDWELAPSLAGAGADLAWCDRVEAVLPSSALGPGLAWVASTVAVAGLLTEVKDATRRVSDLVAAVRSYSQLDRASMQLMDVTEGLDSTLVMLNAKLGPDVTVERDYAADVPRIEAVAGELNQVWTNLIDNAVDAMAGQGTLRVATRLDGDRVVVTIADTGPGMPAEVAAHAFEPFFTTKDVGQGTGLGLDISRRIVVERHDGEITVDSEPGCTVMEVRLPVRRTSAR